MAAVFLQTLDQIEKIWNRNPNTCRKQRVGKRVGNTGMPPFILPTVAFAILTGKNQKSE
jgi:hypothetical protein